MLFSTGLVLVLGAACSDGNQDGSAVKVATTAPRSATHSSSGADKPSSVAPTTAPGAAQASNESVSFATADGVTMKGHFYSAAGPKRRALIIAATVDQKAFAPYASQLAGQGIALLTYDPRGVGETGGTKNDAQMDKDLQIAVNLVKSRDYPLVYIFGVGPDAGVAAIKVAAREELAGVAAFSAGAGARTDIGAVSEPKLLMAPDGNADLNTLAQAASSARRVTLASNPPANDPLSASDARQALLDFVLGR